MIKINVLWDFLWIFFNLNLLRTIWSKRLLTKAEQGLASYPDVNWTPLKKRRTLNRLCLFNKGQQNLAKLPIANLTRPSRSSRHMHSQFYYQPFARTNCYKYSFIPNTVYDWTHLPQDIINICCNISVFESKVLSYIS